MVWKPCKKGSRDVKMDLKSAAFVVSWVVGFLDGNGKCIGIYMGTSSIKVGFPSKPCLITRGEFLLRSFREIGQVFAKL